MSTIEGTLQTPKVIAIPGSPQVTATKLRILRWEIDAVADTAVLHYGYFDANGVAVYTHARHIRAENVPQLATHISTAGPAMLTRLAASLGDTLT